MKIYKGTPVCGGTSIGKSRFYKRISEQPLTRTISDTESEKSRFKLAKYIAVKELALIYEKAYSELGEAAALIFHIHQLMLDDISFHDKVTGIIESEKINAEAAVYKAAKEIYNVFDSLDNMYMRERRADIMDISERVIAVLKNESRSFPILTEPSVIIADDLSPSELLLPKKEFVSGIALLKGSEKSHTAIIASKMNIPMIINLDLSGDFIPNGEKIEIDGETGTIVVY
ncbi:MAG: phosphoenolpyruvate-utilizing N-terminal domain-containing protein [Clostridia bacterium]|nr:phosphoenolpyruvate-utilizing N-terminal domain-containing protein [Clostridia bacterium]